MPRSNPQKKRRGAKKAMRPRRRNVRRGGKVGDYASCRVTRDLGYDSNGTVYKLQEWALSGFPRAVNVAANYQYYRINLVELKFIPTADTYMAGNPGELPNLYYVIDKSDSIPSVGIDLNALINAGAKPIRFDDKTITVRFKPAVTWKALDENGAQTNFGMTKVSPWLATNDANTQDAATWSPSSVDHHGIVYLVTGGVSGQNYRVEMTTHFEFKKPLYYTPQVPGQESSTPVIIKKV